jgi:hypothetical protein
VFEYVRWRMVGVGVESEIIDSVTESSKKVGSVVNGVCFLCCE